MWQPLSLTAGVGDPRLIGVVNDPRAYARDYDGSDMGEIALPPGTPPDEILGVYRLDEFDPTTPASQPGAFNYWIPGAAGGTAQLVTDTTAKPATSRVTGLRLGLGRGVAAVVVASYAGVVRVIGSQPVLRIAFIDGIQPGSAPPTPADPNAAPTWTAAPGRRDAQLRDRGRRHRRQPVRRVHAIHSAGVRIRMTLKRKEFRP